MKLKFIITYIFISVIITLHAQPKINFYYITSQDKFPTSNFTTYNVAAFDFTTGATNKTFLVRIKDLTAFIGMDVEIRFRNPISKVLVASYRDTVITSGTTAIVQTPMINSSTLGYVGMLETMVVEHANPANVIALFSTDLLIIERIRNAVIGGMTFQIHYTDNAFINNPFGGVAHAPTYVQNVVDVLNQSWSKQITTWNLCNGLTGNIPSDNDNTYHIVIHNISNLFPVGTLNPDFFWAYSALNDRRIYLDTRPTVLLHSNTVTERELLYMIIPHEFYHGIQWSIIPINTIIPTVGLTLGQEIERRFWLIEGQAKFLETVFMSDPTYNTSSTNACFIKNNFEFSYGYYCKDLIESAYGTPYTFYNLPTMSYDYAIYWRHLYEHGFPAGTTDIDKMVLLRETAKRNKNSTLSFIKDSIMTKTLAALPNVKFKTYDSSLIDFSEKMFFHARAYNPNFPTPNWLDPNNNDYYKLISTFVTPTTAFAGGTQNFDYTIPSSFAHRPSKFTFTRSQSIKVKFNSDPDGDGLKGDFFVKYFVLNGKTIDARNQIKLYNGNGETNICIDRPTDTLVVLVTRLDINEGSRDNYRITISENPVINGYNWMIDNDNNPNNGLNFNVQQKIIGLFADCRSEGATPIHHFNNGIDIKANEGTGIYSIDCGIAYVQGTTVNIGRFRYCNLKNLSIINGQKVQSGDLIGYTNSSNYLSFKENSTILTAIGEPVNAIWLNPLRKNALTPFVDSVAPYITKVRMVRDSIMTPFTNSLFGKVDFIVDAFEGAINPDGTADTTLKCGVYKIGIIILNRAGNPIGDTIKYHVYDRVPSIPINQFYATGSNSTKFLYIATNDPYNRPYNKYWNTRQKRGSSYNIDAFINDDALYSDGNMKIKIIAWDILGHRAEYTIGK